MKKTRILIADDDTMVRIGLKTVIDWEENGFLLVGEAQDGQQALELAQTLHPDIIITDIKMPGMDGIELIERLREKGIATEILVLSSYDEFDLVKKALKLGAKDYLLKLNLEPEELLRCLRSIASAKASAPATSFSRESEKKPRAAAAEFPVGCGIGLLPERRGAGKVHAGAGDPSGGKAGVLHDPQGGRDLPV